MAKPKFYEYVSMTRSEAIGICYRNGIGYGMYMYGWLDDYLKKHKNMKDIRTHEDRILYQAVRMVKAYHSRPKNQR